MSIEADSIAIQNALRRMSAMRAWPQDRLYALVPGVSGWSPAQHLVHLAETTRLILDHIAVLEAGTDPESSARPAAPRLAGRAVLVAGRLPRGRADAPRGTVPPAVPGRAALEEAVGETARRVAESAGRAHAFRDVPGARLHPALGWLGAAQWWRFLRIHLEHHLAIIDDIDRRRAVGDPLMQPTRPLTDAP